MLLLDPAPHVLHPRRAFRAGRHNNTPVRRGRSTTSIVPSTGVPSWLTVNVKPASIASGVNSPNHSLCGPPGARCLAHARAILAEVDAARKAVLPAPGDRSIEASPGAQARVTAG